MYYIIQDKVDYCLFCYVFINCFFYIYFFMYFLISFSFFFSFFSRFSWLLVLFCSLQVSLGQVFSLGLPCLNCCCLFCDVISIIICLPHGLRCLPHFLLHTTITIHYLLILNRERSYDFIYIYFISISKLFFLDFHYYFFHYFIWLITGQG